MNSSCTEQMKEQHITRHKCIMGHVSASSAGLTQKFKLVETSSQVKFLCTLYIFSFSCNNILLFRLLYKTFNFYLHFSVDALEVLLTVSLHRCIDVYF